jgi:excisionase family DNA binding protein
MTEIPDKLSFRIDEVATILCVSSKTIRRMIDDEEIPAIRLRGAVRISRTVIASLLDKKTD